MRERGKLPCLATGLLAQACQHLWLASSHDVYRRFTWIDHAIPPWLPTALMLVVVISPHGSMTIPLDEATLSQELRTARLLQPHVLVGYRWQNTGLHSRSFRSVITNTCVTSCRNLSPNRACSFNRTRLSIGLASLAIVDHPVAGGAERHQVTEAMGARASTMMDVQAGAARPTACAREAIAHLGTEFALNHVVGFVTLRIAARNADGECVELLVWARKVRVSKPSRPLWG